MKRAHLAILATLIITLIYLVEANGLVLAGPVTAVATMHVPIPKLYADLRNLSGNFSTFTVPAFPVAGAAPDIYAGMATYYQAISQKSIVGGLDGRYSTGGLLSLYNIPLMWMAQDLAENITPTNFSPVLENYTAQTNMVLSLYNTAFVIIDRQAYTNASLDSLATYLAGEFGTPVYVDNTTIAYSTQNVSRSLFRDYVAFPDFINWYQVNGTDLWVPVNQGLITVYAPSSANASVETSISFSAMSNGPSAPLELAVGNAQGGAAPIAMLNITQKPTLYKVNATLPSAPNPAALLFITSNSSSEYVGISNITFTRR